MQCLLLFDVLVDDFDGRAERLRYGDKYYCPNPFEIRALVFHKPRDK